MHAATVRRWRADVTTAASGAVRTSWGRDAKLRTGIWIPVDVPAVAAVEPLSLEAPITLLAGDNGSGKSMLSHSQSVLALASNRFGGESLYVLDEPEAALSDGRARPARGMTRAAHAGAQFVVATHSPILLACPEASIYELDDDGIAPSSCHDLEIVRPDTAFLDDPARFVHAALQELE